MASAAISNVISPAIAQRQGVDVDHFLVPGELTENATVDLRKQLSIMMLLSALFTKFPGSTVRLTACSGC